MSAVLDGPRVEESALHVAACKYANDFRLKSLHYRRENDLKPIDLDPTRGKWMAHYEGYVAGFKARP